MSDTSADGDQGEQSWARLREETTRADVYCHEDHKEEWQEEAEHNGQSLSRYLYDLIQEARSIRKGDVPVVASKDERVEELESRIEELQDELEQARAKQEAGTRLTIDDLVEKELSHQCKTIDEIVADIKATDEVSEHLRRQIEERLYSLTEEGVAKFQRGHGWRLTEGNKNDS